MQQPGGTTGVDQRDSSQPAGHGDALENTNVTIVVGTLRHAWRRSQIAEMINATHGRGRVTERRILQWLSQGDQCVHANHVLHLALSGSKLVGCVMSTLQPAFVCHKKCCGHWGLLAMAAGTQGTGVEKELVCAAEARLMEEGCLEVRTEYKHDASAHSQQLSDLFESQLGFERMNGWLLNHLLGLLLVHGGEFRRCRKALPQTAA